METDAGDIPDIKMTNFIERDGRVMADGRTVSWSVKVYPDPDHKLSKYLNGDSLHVMAQLDLAIYTTENVRYMKMLQIVEQRWIQYWQEIIIYNKNTFELGGAL